MAEAFAEGLGDGGSMTSSLPSRGEFLGLCHSLPSDIQACLSLSSLMSGNRECQEKVENAPASVRMTLEAMGMKE